MYVKHLTWCLTHRKCYQMVTATFMIFLTVNAHRFVYTTSPNWLAPSELSPSLSSAPPPPLPKNPVQDLFFYQDHWNSLRPSLLALVSFSYFCYSWSLVCHSLCFRKGFWALTCSRSRPETIVRSSLVALSLKALANLRVKLSLLWPAWL